MTTRNFVPRIDGEGQVGTETKKWSKIYSNSIYVNNIIGDLTGTADKAIKDNKNQQIDSTYIKNISVNNDTLTVTKGNDGSQDITINNISHAISSDNAINANKLQKLTAGNSKGQIPINNGIENVNLNAALLNGKASSYFATSNHTHTTATQSSNGYMSNADKKKLDGIASGAEVNQNAFANVKVGSTTIQADAKQDTLELAAGANISLVGDANNDKVTIGVTGKVASATTADKVNGIANDGDSLDLVTGTMAGNDNFRIRIGGSHEAGYAEIATADDGEEPIYVRQYRWMNSSFSDLVRTATILDSSGNTSFPGKVTASGGFSGNLSGTATSATRLSNQGTIAATTLPNSFTTGLTTHAVYNNSYPVAYGNVINIYHSGKSQLLCEWKGDDTAAADPGHLYYRECRDNQNAWSNWKAVAFTTDNVSSATNATYSTTQATTDNSTKIATTAYVKNNISETLKKVYPVGSIYMSTVSTNPATLFGFGTWEAMPAGRVLLAQGTASWGTYNAGSTGGEATHTLTVGEMPAHNHVSWKCYSRESIIYFSSNSKFRRNPNME